MTDASQIYSVNWEQKAEKNDQKSWFLSERRMLKLRPKESMTVREIGTIEKKPCPAYWDH